MNNSGFAISKHLRAEPIRNFGPIFKRWAKMHDIYWDLSCGDLPFWYTERTCVSFFASAIWSAPKSKFAAATEFQTDKRKNMKSSKTKLGYGDLYITGEENAFICEAKLATITMPWTGSISDNIKGTLLEAKADAHRSISEEEYDHSLALTLWRFRVKNSVADTASLDRFLTDILNSLENLLSTGGTPESPLHAYAYWFLDTPEDFGDECSLGTAVGVEVVRSGQ